MALLHESVDYKKMDVRLVERNIARGVLSREELNQALETLPDDSENADFVQVDALMGDAGDSEMNRHGSY